MTAGVVASGLTRALVEVAGRARIAIAGGPRVGKTTLSHELYDAPMHADSEAHRKWSDASAEVATWFNAEGPWVIEGVCIARALRKWLAAHPTGRPCDVAIVLEATTVQLTRGQLSMAKGCATVWHKIEGDLVARGVRILRGWPRVVSVSEVETAA